MKEHYCIQIDKNISDPFNALSYPQGYDNFNFSPIQWNKEKNSFELNEWNNTFIIKKIKYDVFEEHKLIIIGFPLIWIHFTSNDNTIFFYFSNEKINENYHLPISKPIEDENCEYMYTSNSILYSELSDKKNKNFFNNLLSKYKPWILDYGFPNTIKMLLFKTLDTHYLYPHLRQDEFDFYLFLLLSKITKEEN